MMETELGFLKRLCKYLDESSDSFADDVYTITEELKERIELLTNEEEE